ncbi:MAG: hypothetical protein HYV60_08890 [Planctomycetia bacterium]|nr:hypothetical protein [Planctomycetia bacterium]
MVTLIREDGKKVEVELAKLSSEDNEYIKGLQR